MEVEVSTSQAWVRSNRRQLPLKTATEIRKPAIQLTSHPCRVQQLALEVLHLLLSSSRCDLRLPFLICTPLTVLSV